HNGSPRHQGENAQFLAFQTLFDDHLPAGSAAELFAHHDALDGGSRFLIGRTDDDAFAGGETVGLDNEGIIAGFDVAAGVFGMIEDAELGGWHIGMTHDALGENLARFELRRLARRPKNTQTGFLEVIDDATRQRFLRPHHGQRNLLFADERDELIELDGLDGHIHAVLGGAGVARRAENLLGARRLRQLPYQGMFAPTLPDDKYLH